MFLREHLRLWAGSFPVSVAAWRSIIWFSADSVYRRQVWEGQNQAESEFWKTLLEILSTMSSSHIAVALLAYDGELLEMVVDEVEEDESKTGPSYLPWIPRFCMASVYPNLICSQRSSTRGTSHLRRSTGGRLLKRMSLGRTLQPFPCVNCEAQEPFKDWAGWVYCRNSEQNNHVSVTWTPQSLNQKGFRP